MSDDAGPADDGDGGRRPAYPPGTLRVGSIRGVDVLVRSSWFLVALLIAVLLAPRIEQVEPGLGVFKYVAGLAFAVLFYLSLLLHEISHALMAQRYGLGVRSISLVFLGGFTEIDSETRTPGQEFKVAVVGPLTSIAVGLLFIPLLLVTPDGLLHFTVGGLAFANIIVGAYNLIPGLPFDGGHVLKSLVWRITGNMHRGTIVAAWGGRVAAVLVLFWPWLLHEVLDTQPAITDYLLAVFIAVVPVVGRHRVHAECPRATPAALVEGSPPRPTRDRRARRPAGQRGRTPCPGGRRRGDRGARGRRPAQRHRQRDRPARHAGGSPRVGPGQLGRPVDRGRAGAAGRHRGRGPRPGHVGDPR